MAKAWAKFPNQWVVGAANRLHELSWGTHRTTALATILVMIALAVRLNLAHRTREKDFQAKVVDNPVTQVQVSISELQELTGLARATVIQAVGLLAAFGAIRISKKGRANIYELVDLDRDGKYCQLPQEHLMDGSSTVVRRLAKMPRTRISLLAMKLYVLLLVRRNQRFNTTAISYSKLGAHTGVRREEIYQALGHLTALELIGLSDDTDARQDLDKSRRYKIIGLSHHA